MIFHSPDCHHKNDNYAEFERNDELITALKGRIGTCCQSKDTKRSSVYVSPTKLKCIRVNRERVSGGSGASSA